MDPTGNIQVLADLADSLKEFRENSASAAAESEDVFGKVLGTVAGIGQAVAGGAEAVVRGVNLGVNLNVVTLAGDTDLGRASSLELDGSFAALDNFGRAVKAGGEAVIEDPVGTAKKVGTALVDFGGDVLSGDAQKLNQASEAIAGLFIGAKGLGSLKGTASAGRALPNRGPAGPSRASVQSQLDNLPNGQGAGYHVRQNSNGNFSVVRNDASQLSPLKVTNDGNLYSPVSFGGGRGRLGNAQTRAQNQAVADDLSSRGWDVTNIGRTEEFIPGAQGGTKGSVWIDITAVKPIRGSERTLRVQTADTLADGATFTRRELDNAARARDLLRSRGQNPHVLLIPKSQ